MRVTLLQYVPEAENKLRRAGFFDSPVCIVSINVIRDQFVLVGDISHSVFLIRWHDRKFTLLARSVDPLNVYSTEFLRDGKTLALVSTDEERNVRFWHYAKGNDLLAIKGELCVDEQIVHMISSPLHVEKKWGIMCSNLGGGIGAIVPLEERVFRRLQLLQSKMAHSELVPHFAGLNPISTTRVRGDPQMELSSLQRKRKGNALDSKLIFLYPSLEKVVQKKLASAIGTTVETLIENLVEVDRLTVSCFVGN